MQNRNTVERDLVAIGRIDAVPCILDAVVELTGMRFAAVARVTETRWTACAVRDDLGFGLPPGGDLDLETTICNEIRQCHAPVAFGSASTHPVYSQHHTPKQYGLESYISVPVFRPDGEFFGTLCAIDSRQADVERPGVLTTMELFARLIGIQLGLVDDLDDAHARLHDAQSREEVASRTELEVRDLLQPLVTTVYLLQSSATLSREDRLLLADMDASCKEVARLLQARIDQANDGVGASPA